MIRMLSLIIVMISISMAGCFPNTTGVHLYSEKEKAYELGRPSEQVGATGDITYCASGWEYQIVPRRKQALTEIAQACSGRYTIRGEGDGSIDGPHLRHVSLAPGCNKARIIWFQCDEDKGKK